MQKQLEHKQFLSISRWQIDQMMSIIKIAMIQNPKDPAASFVLETVIGTKLFHVHLGPTTLGLSHYFYE